MKHYPAMTEDTTSDAPPGPFTGRDVLYREKGVSAFDVQRAADALLRRGQKPSIATVREQLGGGSPNTLAPLLDKYWKGLGTRLVAGPEALERVPESLARMTEALWLRSIDEARMRAKASLAGTTPLEREQRAIDDKITELTAALAASRAHSSELESQLIASLQDGLERRAQVRELTALLKAEQELRAHDRRETEAKGRALEARREAPRAGARRRRAGPLRRQAAAKATQPKASVVRRPTASATPAGGRRKGVPPRRTRPTRR